MAYYKYFRRRSHLEEYWPYYAFFLVVIVLGVLGFSYDAQCAAAGWPAWSMTLDGIYCKNLLEAVPLREVIR